MAITKTKFINYTRCNNYVNFEKIKTCDLKQDITYEEYQEEEKYEQIKEVFEELDNSDIKMPSKLESMMDYYKEVEIEAGRISNDIFKGQSIFSKNTYSQKSFSFTLNDIKYLCYVDIYNEQESCINIVEVKATTSNKYTSMTYGKRGDIKFPLFIKTGDFYTLSPCVSIDSEIKKNYDEKISKLLDRFTSVGKYIYDLAVQRYIISHDKSINKKVNYFLAVLNSSYVYDGYMENGKRLYRKINGEDIISLFKLNDITLKYKDIIEKERINLENNLKNRETSCKVGCYCFLNKPCECTYKNICFKDVPKENASFNYLNFKSFKDKNGNTYDKYDLINNGYLKIDDIPLEFLTNENHLIQRDCYDNNKVYVDKEKIKSFLNDLKYPIYHLDFETFPCPMPRFFGEKPYSQSCFEFSLHIERAPGVCDLEKDNYIFLANTLFDEREDLVKALVSYIKEDGTLLAQNVSFEKSRIEELANIFPKYKKDLLRIKNMGYDLLYIIKNSEEISKKLGFIENAKTINYYNPKQSGSYSIKKTLPLFTDLTYSSLDIQNGTEALVSYSMYDKLSFEEKKKVMENLKIYCRQDTWAMVEILRGLRNLVK